MTGRNYGTEESANAHKATLNGGKAREIGSGYKIYYHGEIGTNTGVVTV